MNLPRVFMIGWEFPPHNSGGLGTACQGLTKALAEEKVQQIFVLPKQIPVNASYLEVAFPNSPYFRQVLVNMKLNPYQRYSKNKELNYRDNRKEFLNQMLEDVYRYSDIVESFADMYPHDVIHGHDWMSYPASLKARNRTKKPVVLHVHSTEYDRTLNGDVDPEIAKIEKESLKICDKVIAVSNYTKNMICEKYQIPDNKVEVVHNGIDLSECNKFSINDDELAVFAQNKKVIVFMGRLTCQKGPDYFVQAASKICKKIPNALFVVAGSGDMYEQIIMQSAAHRLTGKLLFAGFLRDRDKEFIFKRADLFIMPSVSEPFGIVALEAASQNTPVIISYQSGVSEVLNSALKTDYWDVEKISQLAIKVLTDSDYKNFVCNWGAEEVKENSWRKAAGKCLQIYNSLV